MDRSDASQPISVTLDGTNFVLWAQAMSSFLKGKKLWRVIAGEVIKPTRGATESQDKYGERLEKWDSKNHQIITWIRNTSVTSINLQLGRFQDAESPAKEIWEFLKERYSTTGLAHQYQLLSHLHRMHQEPGQSINHILSQMYGVWDQLSLSEPAWNDATDAQKFSTYRDQQRLILFLMALTTDFEPVRASLLHRSPLPTLEQAISELLSEETRLGTLKTQHQHLDTVLVTSQSTGRSAIPSSDGDGCRYCHSPDHNLVQCPIRVCKHCHKTGPGHRQYDCPKNPYKQSQPSGNPYKQSNHSGNPYKQSNYSGNSLARGGQNKPHNQFKPSSTSRTAAAAEGSSSDMPFPSEHYVPSISMHDLESILKQVSSHSGTPSPTALSVTSCISSWFFDSAC